MSKEIDIFESAQPQTGEFFKFQKVGDGIQGTYIGVREDVDSFGNEQMIYILKDKDGKIWNVGIRKQIEVLVERMKQIAFGQIVGFKFDEERPSKKKEGTMAKITRIYADEKVVDNDWIERQKSLAEQFKVTGATPPTAPTATPTDTTSSTNIFSDEKGGTEEFPETTAPADAAPASNLPAENEALNAIRSLAKTKGLTTDAMKPEEADEKIAGFSGLPLEEANYSNTIIALTGYKTK